MGYETERLLEFLPWARHFARYCAGPLPSHLDHEDLQSAGVLGYLRAATRYDATRGASFRSYCALRIRGAVLDELRLWDWAPRSVHKAQRRITRITSNLVERLEREPTGGELAAALGVEENQLAAYQTLAQPRLVVSLDEICENSQGEDSIPLTERLPDPGATPPDVGMVSTEERRLMLRCVNRLPENQFTVIVLHYLQEVPLHKVAKLMTVTPSRVSQLHHQALGRLKQNWDRPHSSAPVFIFR